MKKLLLVIAAVLSLPLIAFANIDHGQSGADVCYQGQTVHVNGSSQAVQEYLNHHAGATLGACPPPPPPTPTPTPAPAPRT